MEINQVIIIFSSEDLNLQVNEREQWIAIVPT